MSAVWLVGLAYGSAMAGMIGVGLVNRWPPRMFLGALMWPVVAWWMLRDLAGKPIPTADRFLKWADR